MFGAESDFSVYGGVGNSQLSMCGCCSVFRPDHSSLDFTAFQPRAAGSSFRSSGAASHALCDSLRSCSPIGQLFHSRERRDGEGSASRERGSAVLFPRSPTRVTFDWKIEKKHVAISVNKSRRDTLSPSSSTVARMHRGLQLSPPCVDDAVTHTHTHTMAVKRSGRGAAWALFASHSRTCCTQTSSPCFISSVRGATR